MWIAYLVRSKRVKATFVFDRSDSSNAEPTGLNVDHTSREHVAAETSPMVENSSIATKMPGQGHQVQIESSVSPIKSKNSRSFGFAASIVVLAVVTGWFSATIVNRSRGVTSTANDGSSSQEVELEKLFEGWTAHQSNSQEATPLLSAEELFARCSPAVVKVEVRDGKGESVGAGTGFLVDANGRLIATNYHVVRNAHSVKIVLTHGRKLSVTGALAFDEDCDIAILKVEEWTSIKPLDLADGALPPIGTKVFAIGNPLGLTQTLSDGLVSGHRAVGTTANRPKMPRLIQTTAPISPGSSGGPLIGADGKVIGVTTSFAKGQNLNFAVPASHVARLLLDCDDDTPITRFPLRNETVSNSPKVNDDWAPDEIKNAGHFLNAIRVSKGA